MRGRAAMNNWLHIHHGDAPLIVAFPHTGADIPDPYAANLVSPWRARKDADWHVEKLYAFAAHLGATTVRTAISRTLIDVNRDPSGASLYPGMATTELCPTTTFDGESLYKDATPNAAEIDARRTQFFAPYHAALQTEIDRLKSRYPAIVLYDAHAIRSHVPRLFDGALPHFNVGTNSGASCAPALAQTVTDICTNAEGFKTVRDGRFKGGYTTRFYGCPADNVHAIQMELAFRAFVQEPRDVNDCNWPPTYDPAFTAPVSAVLERVLRACLAFALDQRP